MDIFADLARWIAEQPMAGGWIWAITGSGIVGTLGSLIATFLIGPDERDTTLTGLKLEVLGQIFSGLLVFGWSMAQSCNTTCGPSSTWRDGC
jgi:hypothetical protein